MPTETGTAPTLSKSLRYCVQIITSIQRSRAIVPKRVNENGSVPVRGHSGGKGALGPAWGGGGGALGLGNFTNVAAQTEMQVKRKPV